MMSAISYCITAVQATVRPTAPSYKAPAGLLTSRRADASIVSPFSTLPPNPFT